MYVLVVMALFFGYRYRAGPPRCLCSLVFYMHALCWTIHGCNVCLSRLPVYSTFGLREAQGIVAVTCCCAQLQRRVCVCHNTFISPSGDVQQKQELGGKHKWYKTFPAVLLFGVFPACPPPRNKQQLVLTHRGTRLL